MNWQLFALILRKAQAAPQPTSLSGRFARAIALLRSLVANFGAFGLPTFPFVDAACHRLERLGRRLDTLLRKYEAGTLPPPKPARPRHSHEKPARPAKPKTPAQSLPTRYGWMQHWVRLANQSGIDHLIAHPDLPAVLAAAPQAGRILRPLCHMLAIPRPDFLATNPRPTKAAKPATRKRRAPQRRRPPPRQPAPRPPAEHPFRTIPALRHLWYPFRRPRTA